VSCSVHDGIELESRGTPCVAIHTEVFRNSATVHAMAFGRPGFPSVFVSHPIANVTADEVRAKAEEVIDEIARILTGAAE
jgi:hypothetical protein